MWIKPDKKNLEQEYHVEVELKGNNFFNSKEDFMKKAKAAKLEVISPALDKKIAYRSRTKTKDQLLNLIKGYASYPKFRNVQTLENLYSRIEKEQSMTAPIVLRFSDGRMRVLAGNTRMDVAFQLKKEVKALVINN